jgi:hypothetical protein
MTTLDYKWIPFDSGKSISRPGSEGGKIIRDEENTFGARITLEEKGDIAPFSITLGIYGVMVHTRFYSTFEQGQRCFDLYKNKIEQVISHCSTAEAERDETWTKRHNEMMDEILNIC